MVEVEFNQTTGLLYCRFHHRMDSIQATQASAFFNDKLAAIGHSAASDQSTGRTEASPSRISEIIFDLDQVDYVSSGFLRLCLQAAKQVQQGRFRVVNTKPQVMKVFKVAYLDELFKVS
jgi:anti-anti-sigma factor